MTKACEAVSALYKTHVTKPIPTHRDIPPDDYSFDIFVDPNMVSGPTFVTTSSYHSDVNMKMQTFCRAFANSLQS